MAVNLPAPGEDPWDQKLNAAITGIDNDLQATKAQRLTAHNQLTGLNADDHPQYLLRSEYVPGDGGGGGSDPSRYVPVIIIWGESNSGGLAPNDAAEAVGNPYPPASELLPRPSVQIFDNIGKASFQTLDIGTNNNLGHWPYNPEHETDMHGWELSLAQQVESGLWGTDTVYLIKTGQGGSKIADWGVGVMPPSAPVDVSFWQKFLDRTRAGLSILRAAGKVPQIYVWVTIGINDGGISPTVRTGLEEFFVRMRKEVGYVPVFYSEFMPNMAYAAASNAVLADMATKDNMLTIISATGAEVLKAPHFAQGSHWGYEGMKLLSERLGAASRNYGQWEQYESRRIDKLAGGGAIAAPPTALPSLVCTPTSVSFTEGSSGGVFTAKLSAAPAANITIAVTISGGNSQVTPSSVTFTTSNWATAQSVTVTSANDGTASGNRTATVTLASLGILTSVNVVATVVDAGVGPTAPVNTVLPVVSGTAAVGSQLSCTTGTWTQTPSGYTYQWKRAGVAISGATSTTYTVVTADKDTTITCTVTATNAQGSTAATGAGTAIPGDPSTLSRIVWENLAGAVTQDANNYLLYAGGTVKAGGQDTQSIDVTQPFSIVYEWLSTTEAATVAQVLDTVADGDYTWIGDTYVSVMWHANNDVWMTKVVTDAPTNWGWAPSFPCYIRLSKSGNDLIYSSSASKDGPWTQRFSHTGVLAGKTLLYPKVLFTSNVAGRKIGAWFDPAAVPASAPSNQTLPILTAPTGTDAGDTISCSTGGWSGSPTPTYAYQWKLDGTNIVGGTTNTYVVLAGDAGKSLTCVVTATNPSGSVPAESAATVLGQLLLLPVTWGNFGNTTSPQPGVIARVNQTVPTGAMASQTVNLDLPWAIETEYPDATSVNSVVTVLDKDNGTSYAFPQAMFLGYWFNGTTEVWSYDSANSVMVTPITLPAKIMMASSGNDIIFKVAPLGGSYGSVVKTFPGVLAGAETTGYIKVLYANATGGTQMKVLYGAVQARRLPALELMRGE